MKGGERVVFALVLAALNLLILIMGGRAPISAGFFIWIVSFVAGYVSGKSGDIGIILSEPLSIITAELLKTGLWLSTTYLTQTLSIITAIYFLGTISGLTFRSRELKFFKPSVQGLKASIPPFLGGLGINLTVVSAYVMLTEALNLGIPQPSDFGITALLALGTLTTYITSYSLTMRGLNHTRNLLISGLLSVPSVITLPLAVSLQPVLRRLSRTPHNWVPLGFVRRVFKKGSSLYGRLTYLKLELGLSNHLVVIGSTGTGKTNLVRNLLTHLRQLKINSIILDFHGEYSDLADLIIDPRSERINLLDLMGADPRNRAEEVADEIARNYRLGNLQRAALYELLLKAYEKFSNDLTPNLLRDLLRDEGFIDGLSLSREVIKSLIPYVGALGPEAINWIDPHTLLNGVISIKLSAINSLPLQQIISESIIDSIYYLRRNNPGITFLVVEEAHRILTSKNASSTLRIFREGRKFGVTVIAVFQDPTQIASGLLNNASHIVVFKIPDENSRNRILRAILASYGQERRLASKISEVIASLKVGEAVAKIYEGLYLIKSLRTETP